MTILWDLAELFLNILISYTVLKATEHFDEPDANRENRTQSKVDANKSNLLTAVISRDEREKKKRYSEHQKDMTEREFQAFIENSDQN